MVPVRPRRGRPRTGSAGDDPVRGRDPALAGRLALGGCRPPCPSRGDPASFGPGHAANRPWPGRFAHRRTAFGGAGAGNPTDVSVRGARGVCPAPSWAGDPSRLRRSCLRPPRPSTTSSGTELVQFAARRAPAARQRRRSRAVGGQIAESARPGRQAGADSAGAPGAFLSPTQPRPPCEAGRPGRDDQSSRPHREAGRLGGTIRARGRTAEPECLSAGRPEATAPGGRGRRRRRGRAPRGGR